MNRCLWPTLPAAYSQGWGSRRIQSKKSTKKNKNHKQIKSTPEGVDVCIVHVHMCARATRIHYTTIAFDTLNNAQRCMCDTNTSWFTLNLTNITETYIFLCSCTICSNCLSFGFEPQNQHTYTYTPKHAHNKDKSHKRRKRRQKWYKGSSNSTPAPTNIHRIEAFEHWRLMRLFFSTCRLPISHSPPHTVHRHTFRLRSSYGHKWV